MSARLGAPGAGSRRIRTASGLALAAICSTSALTAVVAHADPASYAVVDRAQTQGVTADALPTTQIDGVAWSQKIVGNTVYVGGEFANARPAGAAAGTSLTPRANLLAYDLTTGNLVDSFSNDTNAAVNVVAKSPDGSRIYIGGAFTTVAGQQRFRLAAIDTATGKLVDGFAPTLDASVNAIAVTNTAVYVGGGFSTANGVARQRLAAFDPSTGALLGWAPTADNSVKSMTTTPDLSRVVIGGQFAYVNGSYNPGSASLDATTGTTQPWAFNKTVKNSGSNSAIFSLTNDGTNIIATGYSYTVAQYEGVALIDPMTGAIKWLNDCHGDSYGATVAQGLVYVASHEHNCENMGSFPQTSPDITYKRATAFTYAATGTVKPNKQTGYSSYAGNPSPSQVDWFPDLVPGTYTGQQQAAWSVESSGDYVVYGGEFPTVNGTPQQGLVRFATPAVAPRKQGPLFGAAETQPTVTVNGTVASLTWKTSLDRDNEALTYQVYRDDDTTKPLASVPGNSLWWDRPTLSYVDTAMTPGKTYTYWVWAVDADGNRIRSNNTTVTAGQPTPSGTYLGAVLKDSPLHLWHLSESTGAFADSTGALPLTPGNGATRGQAGVLADNQAVGFNGLSGGWAYASATEQGSNDYTSEVWVKTTSTSGGMLMGQGNKQSNTSSTYDRQVYMTSNGRLAYAINAAGTRVAVTSTASYNDGKWHHVAASLSSAGMKLYVDGALVGSDATRTAASTLAGYWRLGGDTLTGVPNRPASNQLAATLDEPAVYPHALSQTSIRAHVKAAGATLADTPPTAAFTASCAAATCSFDGSTSTDAESGVTYAWDFGDGTTATGVSPSHTFTTSGTHTVTLTVTDDAGLTNATSKTLTVTVPNQPPTSSFTAATDGLTVQVDGSASTDPDGTIAEYAWDFGDGGGGTGVTASHTYTAPGVFTVTLTTQDDAGATTTSTRAITVLASGHVIASDDFSGTRTRWGAAQVGGAWTYPAGGSTFATTGGTGTITLNAGTSSSASLAGASGADVSVSSDVTIDKVTTGGGVNVMLVGRRTSTGEYRAKLRLLSDGTARIGVARVVGGTETVLKEVVVAGGYQAGQTIHVTLDLTGTTVAATAWSGAAAPATPSVQVTDTTAGMQAAGTIGVMAYASASATNVPFTVGVAKFAATATA